MQNVKNPFLNKNTHVSTIFCETFQDFARENGAPERLQSVKLKISCFSFVKIQ